MSSYSYTQFKIISNLMLHIYSNTSISKELQSLKLDIYGIKEVHVDILSREF